jgi:hypothetical protein
MPSVPTARRAASAVALALAAAAVAVPAAHAAPTGDDLFTATAAGGRLTKVAGDTYKLRLVDPAATVSAFTDRPVRQATTQTLKRFVADWDDYGFAADPPNAALVLDQAPAAHDTYMFELSNPQVGRRGNLTFTAKRIGARPAGALEPIARRADRGTPRGFGRASLFVDDGSAVLPIAVNATIPAGQNVVLDFGGDTLQLQPSTSYHPSVQTDIASTTNFSPTDLVLTSGAGNVGEATAAIALDHDGDGPIVGDAIVPAGAKVTVTVNGGAPVTIGNGPFSIPA